MFGIKCGKVTLIRHLYESKAVGYWNIYKSVTRRPTYKWTLRRKPRHARLAKSSLSFSNYEIEDAEL